MQETVLTATGFVEDRLDARTLLELQHWASACIANNFAGLTRHQHALVGQIEHSYAIPEPQLELIAPAIRKLTEAYLDRPWSGLTDITELRNINSWINFQREHEFNPPHTHAGLLSWVCWLQLPTASANQSLQTSYGTADYPLRSYFEFYYADPAKPAGLDRHTLQLTEADAGRCIVFPARLWHAVTPFATRGWRISLSGNITDPRTQAWEEQFEEFRRRHG